MFRQTVRVVLPSTLGVQTNRPLAVSPVARMSTITESLKRAAANRNADQDFLLADFQKPRKTSDTLLLGLVCYDPSVPSIWKGMMRHFARCELNVDFITFNSYERLVDALNKGFVDVAWNGPLAHARCIRLHDGKILSLGMRDVDRDFVSHIIVSEKSKISKVEELNAKTLATGTIDSPQGYLMPLWTLEQSGKVDLKSLNAIRFDRDIGKHGDTALGEDGVLTALTSNKADFGFISHLMWKRYESASKTKGLRILNSIKVVDFDHCQFTALEKNKAKVAPFSEAILSMHNVGPLAHAENASIMKLEGIKEKWMPSRDVKRPEVGYENMLAALKAWDEPIMTFPGLIHTQSKHPFKTLTIDYRLIRDANGC